MQVAPLVARTLHVLLILVIFSSGASANGQVFVFDTPISGDVVSVTLELTDRPGGDGVDVSLSIPPGEGDLLGLFGNVGNATLVPGMAMDDPSGLITQWQFKADNVWKVGGGNVVAPVKKWDWGLRIGQQGSSGGAVESAAFGLVGVGLDTAQLLATANQGWVFGVRIQSTTGAEGSAKIGMPEGTPPLGDPPTIEITAPAPGSRTVASSIAVMGNVTGSAPLQVDVNGVVATVSAGSFSADVTLAPGDNDIIATATNAFGQGGTSLSVFRGQVPAIQIGSPDDGLLTGTSPVSVSGVASGLPDPTVVVAGITAPVSGGAFSADVALVEGPNTLEATATNEFGSASDAVSVVLDTTPPIVVIATPADGAVSADAQVVVEGTVMDASPIASLRVNGQLVPLVGSGFSTTLTLPPGLPTPIEAVAVDAVGNVGSDAVTVTFVPAPTLTITIDTPPDGALVSSPRIAVAGSVSDGTASVEVNGVAATVVGGGYVAPQVELAEGPNPLVATATVGASSATATSTVTFNAPPEVVITSPRNGAFLEAATTDVEGLVDDPTAFVDVEGIVARVDSAGRFVAQGVSVPNGTSSLTARAVDAFGAAGTDSVEVTREDGVVGRLRVVVALPDRRGFGFEEEIEEQDPVTVVAENGAEFRAVLEGLGLPPSGFEPAVENVHLGFHTQDLHIFVFAEAGTVGALVSVPVIFDEFFNFSDSAPLEPISGLESDVLSSGLGLGIVPDLLPSDFDPNGFVHFDVFVPVGN